MPAWHTRIRRRWTGADAREKYDAMLAAFERRVARGEQRYRPELVDGWADETPLRRVIYAPAGRAKSRGINP